MKHMIALFWCALMLAVAPSASYAQEGSRLDVVVKRDKLIVATYSSAPPLAFTDETGELVGFEVDIARMIAKDLLGDANKVEFQIVQSEGRFPSVLSGRADFGIAATTIYPERAAKVAFTAPYMDNGVSIVVRRDANVHSFAELNDSKFTVAGQTNPQDAERAKRFFPKAKTLFLDTPGDLALAIKSGRATAIQYDAPVADYFVSKNPDMMVVPDLLGELTVSNNSIFIKPGDFTWWLFLDTYVNEMRYGSRYAEYKDLYNKWFGKNPPAQRFYIGNK